MGTTQVFTKDELEEMRANLKKFREKIKPKFVLIYFRHSDDDPEISRGSQYQFQKYTDSKQLSEDLEEFNNTGYLNIRGFDYSPKNKEVKIKVSTIWVVKTIEEFGKKLYED